MSLRRKATFADFVWASFFVLIGPLMYLDPKISTKHFGVLTIGFMLVCFGFCL